MGHRQFARVLFSIPRSLLLSLPLLAGAASAATSDPAPPTSRASPPPSASLAYDITARYGPLTLSGNAQMDWRNAQGRFTIRVLTHANVLGKLLESTSEGVIRGDGLHPRKLTETRLVKKTHTVTFDPQKKRIRFSASPQTYPLRGGEQDRTSVTWQLVSLARAAPERLTAGTQWTFFVAGRRNAETWSFRVVGHEVISSALGKVDTLHITKLPSAGRKGQTLDLWLAPSLEGYPMKMVYTDDKGLQISQRLTRLSPLPTDTRQDTP